MRVWSSGYIDCCIFHASTKRTTWCTTSTTHRSGMNRLHALLLSLNCYVKRFRHVARSLAGEIQHPVEFVFNIIVPLMAGPVLMACISGVHSKLQDLSLCSLSGMLLAVIRLLPVYTYWIWMSFRIMRGADAHSNHYLPFHPLRLISPIYGGPLYHGYAYCVRDRLLFLVWRPLSFSAIRFAGFTT
jgi:hypothetical protein